MSHSMLRSRGFMAFSAVLMAGLVLAACGDDDGDDEAVDATTTTQAATTTTVATSPEPAVLTVEASGDGSGTYSFSIPDTVDAGPTRVSLVNRGAETHHVQLFKLNDGVAFEDFGAALGTGEIPAILAVSTLAGGTSIVDPGGTSMADAVVDLTPGTWVAVCFIEGENGPHATGGMVQPFEVTGQSSASLPEATAEISLVDFGFQISGDITTDGVIELTNASTGMEPHEMAILRPTEGTTTEDVLAFFGAEGGPDGPPPFSGVGGLQGIMPGSSQLLQLDLEPGRYIVVCFIPSADGVPHAAKGMIQEVEIT